MMTLATIRGFEKLKRLTDYVPKDKDLTNKRTCTNSPLTDAEVIADCRKSRRKPTKNSSASALEWQDFPIEMALPSRFLSI